MDPPIKSEDDSIFGFVIVELDSTIHALTHGNPRSLIR
jgi:hypothetical protein